MVRRPRVAQEPSGRRELPGRQMVARESGRQRSRQLCGTAENRPRRAHPLPRRSTGRRAFRLPSVHDDTFVIRDNTARAVPAGDNWWWDEVGGWTQSIIRGARRLLPDAGDEKTPPLVDAKKNPLAPLPTKLVEHHPQPPKAKSQKNPLARGGQANGLHANRRARPWWAKYNDKADLELVRDWIRENLPEGHEIRWWKPRDLIAFGWSRVPSRSAVLSVEDSPRHVFFLRARGRLPDQHAPERVCRIKVRVDQPNKPPKVEDRLFVIASRQVEPIIDPQHKRREWKYFPEAAGEKPNADD
jgi:hypothetical protein